jgi:hypothetical protein
MKSSRATSIARGSTFYFGSKLTILAEAKHTIDMVRFVDAAEIDSRY